MKKLFFLLFVIFFWAGCEENRNTDYTCPRSFEIFNNTEQEITYQDTVSEETITIAPGQTRQVFTDWFPCSGNELDKDLFDISGNHSFAGSPAKHSVSINGRILSEEIWQRKNWNFAQGESFPTYTLVITEELIATFQTENPTQTRASAVYRVNQNNPYSLHNVQRALNIVVGSSAPTLRASHYYIRVLPKDTIQLRTLTNDLELDMFPFPFDDDDLTDAEIETHENTLINGFAWQYCLVKPDFRMPSGIEYEVLDYAYLQDDEPGTRASGDQLDPLVYGAAIDKAMELAGYVGIQTRATWQPSATIKYNSGVSGEAVIPLENVLVRANTTFNSGEAYTDASGNVTITKGWGGKFRKATKYIIIWSKKGQWKIHDRAGKAKHKGPKQKSHWNFTVSGDGASHTATSATIHRALNYYYNRTPAKASGLTRYNNIDVKEHHNDSKIIGFSHKYGSFDNSLLVNEIHVYGKTYRPLKTEEMLSTTFHELGHASHRTFAGSWSGYDRVNIRLLETWANGVRYAFMSSVYPNKYAAVLDGRGYSDSYTAIIESLMWQGVTLSQLQTLVKGKDNLNEFRTAVKGSTNIPYFLVDYIFDNPTVPLRMNISDPVRLLVITGPNFATLNRQTTYSVPASLPAGFSFNGWSISPSTGWRAPSLSGSNLNITFSTPADYNINANFTLPNGSTLTLNRFVDLSPVLVVTPMVEASGLTVQVGRTATFYVTNHVAGATYEWMNARENSIRQGNLSSITYTMPREGLEVRCRMVMGDDVSGWSTSRIVNAGGGFVIELPQNGEEEEEDAEQPEIEQ